MKKSESIRSHASGVVVGFAVQFLLGMTLNLFVKIPTSHPGTNSKNSFAGAWHGLVWTLSGAGGIALLLHVVVGLALFVGCFGLCIRGLKLHSRLWAWIGGIAALSTLGAIFHGLGFINTNNDSSSMVMAISWLISVGALVFGLTRTVSRPTPLLK